MAPCTAQPTAIDIADTLGVNARGLWFSVGVHPGHAQAGEA
jgi:hypothetical protein